MGRLRNVASPYVMKCILVGNKPITLGHVHGDGIHMYDIKFEQYICRSCLSYINAYINNVSLVDKFITFALATL